MTRDAYANSIGMCSSKNSPVRKSSLPVWVPLQLFQARLE